MLVEFRMRRVCHKKINSSSKKWQKTFSLPMEDYQLPLPLRTSKVNLVNNREQAVKRAQWQRKKKLNPKYHEDYVEFVEKLVTEGYAYKVPEDQSYDEQPAWYLPHHCVYLPKKPNKIRVVFDCSAKYRGSSLNDKLMQVPDMTYSLIGVLIRFRLERVTLMGDIKSMFYQPQIPEVQHKYPRFLWWPGGELESELTEYRMGVHIFGAVSSPSITNYASRAAADHAGDKYGQDVERTFKTNFYVDDYLKSVPLEEQALRLVKDVTAALKERGFRLTKFVSNSLDKKPLTRRGILSTVCSLYDPLGFVTPFLLPAKRILRKVYQDSSFGWDDVIPEKYLKPWRRWLDDLPILGNLKIPRCVKPKEFGVVELEGSTSFAVHPEDEEGNAVDKFLKYYSSWHRLRMAVAMDHRLYSILKSKRQAKLNGSITAEELDAAGKAVIRYI
ncbi:uncharacterized protein [Palaemon carinicauda]|uniref:uncharacterized protein n=1 Tax=Palaemon carinicauda TaxID=392227 RepID=UPI0035B5C615